MNKKPIIAIIAVIFVLMLGAFYFLKSQIQPPAIGGDRDSHGCLIPAGYAWNDGVGACIRSFEMTKDIMRAAQIAVSAIGRKNALTVVSFNSYEEVGAYDITFEYGSEHSRETVYIKNWQATSVGSPAPAIYPDTQSAIRNILANKYKRPLSEVKVTVDKEVQGFAAGSVLFGQGGPGEGGMWLAVQKDEVRQVVFDGNGSVDCNKMRQEYGFPDTILTPNFCQP